MVQRKITMQVDQERLVPSTRIAGYEGEHLATLLCFVLPESWILDDNLTYYVSYYVEGSGKRYRTDNQQWPIEVSLPQSVMVEGRLVVQLNAIAQNDPQNSIIKSAACTMLVKRSVQGAYDEVDDSTVGLLEGAVAAFEAKMEELDTLVGLPEQIAALDAAKVDKEEGKILTSNDYTDDEKEKLASVAPNANNYVHPTTAGNKHIPAGGSSGQILRWSENGTAAWGADKDTTYTAATTSSAGLMSAADKTKLNGVAYNANNYVHPTTAGNKHIPAGGSSGQILRWSENGTAAWGADKDTQYSVATPSTNGLLSSADKTKLDAIKAKAGTGSSAMILNNTYGNSANGTYSVAFNSLTSANGDYSSCFGCCTTSNGYQLVIGRYNINTEGPTSSADFTGSLFVVGKGYFGANANAFRISTEGAVYGYGPYSTSGADYAELFEWADGNPDKVDRRGQFVTLEGRAIRTARSGDNFILGVVSAFPAMIGNAQDDQWQGMFLRDIYGTPILEEVMEPAYTDDEGVEHPAQLVTREKVNPDYDAEQVYIPRSKRPEWDAIGMMGQLVVIDDGTCEVNSYCRPTDGGIATADPDGPYRVMERLDDTHIRILFPGSGKI